MGEKRPPPSIQVDRSPSEDRLRALDARSWPIWTKEESEFPWEYDEPETCLFLEGEVTVSPEGGTAVDLRAGDVVTFPRGLRCTWRIKRAVRKHYRFG